MLASAMPQGISVRPATQNDQPFLELLYRSSRPDLQLIDGDPELIETVVAQQMQVLEQGAGNQYPNAMHLIIEKTQHNVGALVVDFGPNEVRVIYIAFIPVARGFGYGKAVLQGVLQAAAANHAPVAVVVWRSNPGAKKIYLELGFKVEESTPMAERMIWYPGTPAVN